jgi:hypothetical protein
MKNKILILMTAILLLISIGSVISEEYLYNTVSLSQSEQTVNNHAFYWFDDTSETHAGMQKDIPITFYYVVQQLPYNLTNGNVDWCNFTITHFKNIYGVSFEFGIGWSSSIINTTIETQNVYFTTALITSGQITVNVRKSDTISADMKCHYENVSDLYEDNLLIGQITTYMPSFECNQCSQFDFEQLTYQTENAESITQNQIAIYDRIQTVIDWNFQIWLILSWIIKIVFLLLAVGLIFSGVYFFYQFLKKISESI